MAISALTYSRPQTVQQAYLGAVYDPYNDRVWFVPYKQAPKDTWHYLDCATDEFVAYENGLTVKVNDNGYWGGAYDPIKNRIYFAPYGQSIESTWHYIDCETGEVVPYVNPFSMTSQAYAGAAYDPLKERIYFCPSYGNLSEWHYVDCSNGEIKSYDHGIPFGTFYGCNDAVYNALEGRIYFVSSYYPPTGGFITYVKCSTGAVKRISYTTPNYGGGYGGALDTVNNRIYIAPDSNATYWSYIDCATNTIVEYTHAGVTVDTGAYRGAVFDASNNRMYFIPYGQSDQSNWHYVNCSTGVVTAYPRGASVTNVAYQWGVYVPSTDRIYFSPSYISSVSETWHYIDCDAGGVLSTYVFSASMRCVVGAYWGSVYDPINDRIYFVPYGQSYYPVWHYLDCATGKIVAYAHGATCGYTGYRGGVYDPINERIYFVPYGQADQSVWHYVDCATGDVVGYTHVGISVQDNGYIGGAYDPENHRIYFAPCTQGNQTYWHYIDCDTGNPVAYTHAGVSAITNAYAGAVYDPNDNRIYFIPYGQANQTNWHYIDCTTGVPTAYAHGATVEQYGYCCAAYDPTNKRIWLSPYWQADSATWHYIDCDDDGAIVGYAHGVTAVNVGYAGAVYVSSLDVVFLVPYNQGPEDDWHYIDCQTLAVVAYSSGSVGDDESYAGDGVFDAASEKTYLPPYYQSVFYDWHYLSDAPPPEPFPPLVPPPSIPEQTFVESRSQRIAHFTDLPTTLDSIWFDGTVLLAGDPVEGKIYVWIHAQDGSWNKTVITSDPGFGGYVAYAGDTILYVDNNYAGYALYYNGAEHLYGLATTPRKFALSSICEGSYTWSQWVYADQTGQLVFEWDGKQQILPFLEGSFGVGLDIGYDVAAVTASGGKSVVIYRASPPASMDRVWEVEQIITIEGGGCWKINIFEDRLLFLTLTLEAEEVTWQVLEIWRYDQDLGSWVGYGNAIEECEFAACVNNKLIVSHLGILDKRKYFRVYEHTGTGSTSKWVFSHELSEDVPFYGRILNGVECRASGEGSRFAVLSPGHIHVYDFGESWIDAGRIVAGDGGFRVLATDGTRVIAASDWWRYLYILVKIDGVWTVEDIVDCVDYFGPLYTTISAAGIYGNYAAACVFHGSEAGSQIGILSGGPGGWSFRGVFSGYSERQIIIGDGFVVIGEYGILSRVKIVDFSGELIADIAEDGPALAYDHETGILVVGNEVKGFSIPTRHFGEVYVWRNVNGAWSSIATLEPPSYFSRETEFGQSVATSGGWIAVGSSDTRIFMYEVYGDSVIHRQDLFIDHGLWGITWSLFLDQNRLYLGCSGGDLETDGRGMMWELLADGKWYFRQHLRSADFIYDSNGTTEIIGVGDDILACTLYYGTRWDPYKGSIVLWQLGDYKQAGRLQLWDRSIKGLGSRVAVSSDWAVGSVKEGESIYIFRHHNGAWIQNGSRSIEAVMTSSYLNEFESDYVKVDAGESGFGRSLSSARRWLAVGTDFGVKLYTCEPPTVTFKQDIPVSRTSSICFSDNTALYLLTAQELINCVAYEHGVSDTNLVDEAYLGGVYDPTNDRIWFVPFKQAPETVWHYFDCATETVVGYSPAVSAVEEAYSGGVYDPINDRIYFVPYAQGPELTWHYIDCVSKTVEEYDSQPIGVPVSVSNAYFGGVYDPDNKRIYFVPYAQAAEDNWHFIDCEADELSFYTHGVSAVENAYRGGAHDPISGRIFFAPYTQAEEDDWHYLICETNTVTAYTHGATVVENAYWGACYSETNGNIWLAPYGQSAEQDWHKIDPSTATVISYPSNPRDINAYCGAVYIPGYDIIILVPFALSSSGTWDYIDCSRSKISVYDHRMEDTLEVSQAYAGGVYSPENDRFYFIPYLQIPGPPDPDPEVIDPRTFWHYILFGSVKIFKRTDELWSLSQTLKGFSANYVDAYFPHAILGDSVNGIVQIIRKGHEWEVVEEYAEEMDGFGKSASITGGYAAVGADGQVVVYRLLGLTWSQSFIMSGGSGLGNAISMRRDILALAEKTSDGTAYCASLYLYKMDEAGIPHLINKYLNYQGAGDIGPGTLASNFFGNIFSIGSPKAPCYEEVAYTDGENIGSVNIVHQIADFQTGYGIETGFEIEEEIGQAPYLINLNPGASEIGVIISSPVFFTIFDNNDDIDITTVLIYIEGSLVYSGVYDTFYAPFSRSKWLRVTGGYHFAFFRDSNFTSLVYVVVQVFAKDRSNNLLSTGYEFLTRDDLPPYLDNTWPFSGQSSVPIGSHIKLDVVDDEKGLVLDSIRITVDGELAYNGATDLFLSPYDGIFSKRTPTPYGQSFVLDRGTDFGLLQLVTVQVEATDDNAHALDTTYSFTTEALGMSAYFPCLHVSSAEMGDVLLNPDVSISRSTPWVDVDGNNDLVMMSDDSGVTLFTMSLPIGQKFTFEITFKPSALPTNLDQLDISRLFIAVFDEQDNAGGVLISKGGIAIVSSFGNSVLPIAGSQNIFVEGEDYFTMRIVVDGTSNAMDLYVTATDDLPNTGHVLRYTTGAPVTPETVPDSIRIEVVGQPSARTEIAIDSMYGNCTDLVAPNRRPVADTGDDQTAVIGSVVMLDGTASYDPEGEDLTYLWSVVGTPSTSEFKQVGDDGFTIDDGDTDGFTTIFQVTSGDPWSAENSPNLQPGDILVVSNVQYVISTVDWVTNPLGGWLRDVGFDPNRLLCTLDALPDSLSGKQWTVYFQSSFWDDRTKPQPTFVPDISGPYDIQLVVNDGELDSLPAAGFVNISETNTVFGYIPDVNFIWEHLSDVWNLYDDRDRVTTIWSGFAQIATNLLLTAWQNDYSKTLVDIQRQFQRRWLHYDPLYLEPEDERDEAELRIVRGKILTPVTGGKTFDPAGETLIISKNGSEVIISFAGSYTPGQIASEINAELGDRASVTQPASIETDTGVDYLSLQYDGLLVISKDGTANATLGFYESEDTQNDLSGVDGDIGTATTAWVTGSAGVSPDNLTNLSEVVEKGDVLVVGGQGYEILKIASSRQLTTRRDLSGSGDWLISSYVKAKTTNFSEQLVYAGDILILEVRYAGSNDTREVLCEVTGVRETRCGFNPRSLLEYTSGDLDAYEITFKGVRRVSAIPVNELVLRIPRLQEIILDPPSVLILNSQYTLQDTADGIRGIFFTDGLFSYDNPPPDQLWAEQTFLDNKQSIEDNFGNVIGFPLDTWEQLTEDLDYLSAVRGLWYAFFNGPSLYNVRIGTQILLGLPFAEVDGIIEDINLTYSAEKIRLLIKDSADEKVIRSYFIPRNVVWEEDGESMVAVNPATGVQYAIGDSVEQFAPLSAGVEIIDWVKDPLWWKGYANQGAMLEIHKYFKFLLLADVDSFNITNLIFAIDFVKKFKPHYTYPFWAVLKRIPPDSINLTDHMELSGYLHLSDDPTTAGALGTGGSLRFDDTDESGRVNWAYDGSMGGGGGGGPESGQFGETPFGDDPFGQPEEFVVEGSVDVSKPAFLYDRRRLCPGEYVLIIMSEFHPGGVFSADFLAVFNNTAYPDGGFPFSGPVAEPPSSAEGSPVSAMMNVFGTSSLGTMPFGKGGTIAGSGGGDYDWGPEIGEIDPLASYPAGYYSRGRVIEDSGL